MLVVCLMMGQAAATTLGGFIQKPIYTFFSLHNFKRGGVNICQSASLQGRLLLEFNSENIIKRICTSIPIDKQNLRLLINRTRKSHAQGTIQQGCGRYKVILTINSQKSTAVAPISRIRVAEAVLNTSLLSKVVKNPFTNRVRVIERSATVEAPALTPRPLGRFLAATKPVVVAIDAGHGGQDPGATGSNGLHEKNVTIAIACTLKTLLDLDPMFKPVLTRNADHFISVMGRSDIARKKGASVLISIHADATSNRNASGASVWVLSSQRANSEMANWLEQHEKQSELLGGAGDLLSNNQLDPYLSQAVLDLQFRHSQRVGYDIAIKVLEQLQRVSALHKGHPEHASLGVLRSPDIPSLLVETGFISNSREEQLLSTRGYQNKIANALYLGLRAYFLAHPLQTSQQLENPSQGVNSTAGCYIVKRGETLSSIACQYGVSIASIRMLNTLKKDNILVGQRLRIPAGSSIQAASLSAAAAPRRHRVVRGDTLNTIAEHYGVSTGSIKRANNMRSNNVILGNTLTIPSV